MIINIRKADEFFYNNQPIKKLQDKQMPSLEREIHILFYKGGAGNGDRTRLTSLGSWDFTTKLCPQLSWKRLLSKSLCINYSTKKPFWQVLFHQNKKPASQRAFLLRATIPGPPAGSAHSFGQAKSPLIRPLPRTTFSYLIYMVVFASRDKSTISFSKNKRTTTTVKPKPATPLLFMLQLYIIHNCL